MEKDKDINWVRTNLRTGKNHSAERGDTLRGICTVIPRLAARKLYGIRTEALRNPHGICADFPRNSSDFVKFLVGIRTEALLNPHGICADFPRNSSDFVKFLVTCTVHPLDCCIQCTPLRLYSRKNTAVIQRRFKRDEQRLRRRHFVFGLQEACSLFGDFS